MKTLVVACIAACLLVSVLSLEPGERSQKLLSLSKRDAGLEQLGDDVISREKRGWRWWRRRRRKACRVLVRCRRTFILWREPSWCRKRIRVPKRNHCPRYG